jgi:hypothetical protein
MVVKALTFVTGIPKSRSGSESSSESEFKTICWPFDSIRLLVPEFADV